MLENWLIARPASIAFAVSAWIVAALGFALLFVLTPLYDTANRLPALQTTLEIVGGTLFVLAIPAALLLLTGMLLFLLLRDYAPFLQRLGWIFLFFFTVCFGAAIYFFSRYRPQRAAIFRQEMLPHLERLVSESVDSGPQAK